MTASSLQKHKSALRKLLRTRRRALSARQQKDAARKLYRRVVRSPLFRFSRSITFTLARDGEINPELLLREALRRGKACYLPVMNPVGTDRLRFKPFRKGQALKKNHYGIPEPHTTRHCPPRALSLVLLPLVAFDADCRRLGMGKGYYDRTFAFLRHSVRRRPALLGLAHECQRVESLEVASWDVPLDGVVTDRNWYGGSGGR